MRSYKISTFWCQMLKETEKCLLQVMFKAEYQWPKQKPTWRQSRASSMTMMFLVSNAIRSGFRTSSAWAPPKVCPALAKAVVIDPPLSVGRLADSTSSAAAGALLDWSDSVADFSAPASLAGKLLKETCSQKLKLQKTKEKYWNTADKKTCTVEIKTNTTFHSIAIYHLSWKNDEYDWK